MRARPDAARSPSVSRRRSTRSRCSTRTASCATCSRSSTPRSGPTSISSGSAGGRAGNHRLQAQKQRNRLAARTQTLRRNLRLLAALRGHPPARRPYRARRHPLVGPPAGFPHGGIEPRQGAAGEKRGDRAARRERRLCAAQASRPIARRRRPRASPATRPSSQACSRSRTIALKTGSCRPNAQSGAMATIPTSSWQPTRARPRFPTSPTGSRSAAISGWATPSRAAARRATTTKAWASPRRAPGKR